MPRGTQPEWQRQNASARLPDPAAGTPDSRTHMRHRYVSQMILLLSLKSSGGRQGKCHAPFATVKQTEAQRGPRGPHLLSSCRARPSRLQETWGAGYPEAEQRTLTSMPWEKRCDLVWMLTCGASGGHGVDRWGEACQSSRVVPGTQHRAPCSSPQPQTAET